ncbi:MAG: DMT family transporter [Thermodesulfobacteriota bacterium]
MPYVLLICSTLFWSGNFVLSRGMHAEIPPIGLAFWRWLTAFLILAPFGLRLMYRQREQLKRHWRFILCQGLLGVTGFNTLIYLAVQTTSAINAVLVNSCIPVIIVVVCRLVYGERLSLRQCVGVCISFGGVLLIISKGDITLLLQLTFNRGDLLVLLAAFVWAFYSANFRKYPAGLNSIGYLTAIIITGLFFLFPLYLFELSGGRTVVLNTPTVLTICYVALFASVLAFICWNKAVRQIGASRAGPFIHLMVVFSTILAITFLDETLYAHQFQGIVLVFTGIFLTTLAVKKQG